MLQIVHSKTATALCVTSVKNEDKLEFSKIVEAVKVIPILCPLHSWLVLFFVSIVAVGLVF